MHVHGAIGSICSWLECDLLDEVVVLAGLPLVVLTGIVMGMLGICVGMAGTGWMLSICGWGNV